MSKSPIRITRFHYTDLVCAAMNDTTGDTQRILDRMIEDPGFTIDEEPVPGVFYHDVSVNFMYPHEITPISEADIERFKRYNLNSVYGKFGAADPVMYTGHPSQLPPIQEDDWGPDPTQDDIPTEPRKEPSALLAKLLSRLK